ncbi:protoporphyrinogen oxidase [Rhizobium sp. PP-F2F-G38]|nr:protoporphyrinogen oxidase [Rhizobium sp. PP-F2F-G38]
MAKIAVIGGGISGAACAAMLTAKGHHAVVHEKEKTPGGLVRCTTEDGNLFHRVGGHVFNSQDEQISQWFWSKFDRENEFLYAKRNAAISFEGAFVGYPVEQHLYQMQQEIVSAISKELLALHVSQQSVVEADNFFDFLLQRFGPTLCEKYFIPYNSKIWNVNLREMPVSWLAGKLPMPSVSDIITSNILRSTEKSMVHAHFFYPKQGGSQFIIDRLLKDTEVKTNDPCSSIRIANGLSLNGSAYDAVIYTGDIRKLSAMLPGGVTGMDAVNELKSNGTTTVLCSCDANPYSWVYIPDTSIPCHRMIMTGNFSQKNNAADLGANLTTCTVEFVGNVNRLEIENALSALPLNPKMIAVNFEPNSYVIQEMNTRSSVASAREALKPLGIWLCGRFAEWEYYNMDAAIASAARVTEEIHGRLRS